MGLLEISRVTLRALHIDGLVQERRNSIANAVELRLSCINPSIYGPCMIVPKKMNENLLISNSKLMSDSELIWWR